MENKNMKILIFCIIVLGISNVFFASKAKENKIDSNRQLSRFYCQNPLRNIDRVKEIILEKDKDKIIKLLKEENDEWNEFALCLYKSF